MLPSLNVKNVHIHLHMPALPVAPLPVDLGEIQLKATNEPPTERFELSEDGTFVTDHKFGLIWAQREHASSVNHAEAKKIAESTTLAGQPARLPTREELESLRDMTRYNPCIDPKFSSNSGWVWTDDETPWSSGGVFCVLFDGGGVSYLARDGKAFVRPVRSVSPGQ